MKSFLQSLNVDERLTKIRRKTRIFNSVKENIPIVEGYNFMMDILFLPYDKKVKTKYLLVLDDLANNAFDIEPVENKTPSTIVEAMKKMFARGYIKQPYASIKTDGGNEFKGDFNKWCYEHSVMHKVGLPNRHIQVANIERLNRELGRVFNGYMSMKTKQTGTQYYEWSDIINKVCEEINKIRKLKLKPLAKVEYSFFDGDYGKNKFKVGDLVHRALDEPRNEFDEKLIGGFRMGDHRWEQYPRKITQILYYTKKIAYKYMISGIPNESFPESDLVAAEGETRERRKVKGIVDKRDDDGKVQYKVWYKDETKNKADWQPSDSVIEDGGRDLIRDLTKLMNLIDLKSKSWSIDQLPKQTFIHLNESILIKLVKRLWT